MSKIMLKISVSLLCLAGMTAATYANPVVISGAPPSTTSNNPPVVVGNNSAPPSTIPVGNNAPPSTTAIGSYAPPSTVITGYNSPPPSTTIIERRKRKHHGVHVSVNFAGDEPNPPVIVESPRYEQVEYYRQRRPYWVAMQTGEPLPSETVIGGSQFNPNAMFYVCRAHYRGGVHPGKYIGGNCNISYGGRVTVMQNYEVLVSERPLSWVEANNGDVPPHAIPGGSFRGNTFYICQADYENGTHPGKLIGANCHFSLGGEEFKTAYYNVLTG